MKRLQPAKWVAKSLAFVLLMSSASTASETPRFYVECYTSGLAKGEMSKEYAYRLKARGFPESVENGIDINLDEKNIVLSVDSKPTGQKEYSPLYPNLALIKRSEQSCENEQCKLIDYEPKGFEGKLLVSYDKDKGAMSVKHTIAPNTIVESRGACLFVALPSND